MFFVATSKTSLFSLLQFPLTSRTQFLFFNVVVLILLPVFPAEARWSRWRTFPSLWCSHLRSAAAPRWPLTSSPASSAQDPRRPGRQVAVGPLTLGWTPGVWDETTQASSLEQTRVMSLKCCHVPPSLRTIKMFCLNKFASVSAQ